MGESHQAQRQMYPRRSHDILFRRLPPLNYRHNILRRSRSLRSSRPRGLVRPRVRHVADRVQVGKRRVGELHRRLDTDEAVLRVEQRGGRRLQALEEVRVGGLACRYHDEIGAERSPVLQGDGDGLARSADGVAVLRDVDARAADEAVAVSVCFDTVDEVGANGTRRT